MPDREKFLYAAICFGNDARHDCRECDYYIRTNCVEYCDERRIVRDALALLKEQEAKPLRCKECSYHRDDDWCNEHGREVKESDYCSFGAWEGR